MDKELINTGRQKVYKEKTKLNPRYITYENMTKETYHESVERQPAEGVNHNYSHHHLDHLRKRIFA